MTTIAYDSTMLAGDRLCNDNGVPVQSTKIHELCDGNLVVGHAGEIQDGVAFRRWLEAGQPEDKKPSIEKEFCAIVFDRSQIKAFTYEYKLMPMPIEDPFYAIGSGSHFALMAMTLGYSARDAVLKVAELDLFTGYGVDSVMVREPETIRYTVKIDASGHVTGFNLPGFTNCGCGAELHAPTKLTSLENHVTVFCYCGRRHIYSHVKGVFLK